MVDEQNIRFLPSEGATNWCHESRVNNWYISLKKLGWNHTERLYAIVVIDLFLEGRFLLFDLLELDTDLDQVEELVL